MNTINKKIVIECECGSHMLKVMADKEEGRPLDFYLVMFSYGNIKYNLWGRIKIAWQMIRKGTAFDDQLVLNSYEARELSNFLDENIHRDKLIDIYGKK